MKLNDRLYDVLKWIALICIPALATFYVACAGVWGWPYADEIAKTANAVCVLLGALGDLPESNQLDLFAAMF